MSASLFDFMIGIWRADFHLLPEGATVGKVAIVTVDRFLDETAILDQWRHVDGDGKTNYRGATFRSYLPDRGVWYMMWLTPGVAGYSELTGRGVGNEVHTTGAGSDPSGPFRERGRYHDISSEQFFFSLERSYDDGQTFAPFVAFRATRLAASAGRDNPETPRV